MHTKKLLNSEHQNANRSWHYSGGLRIPFYSLFSELPIMCFYNKNTKKIKMYISVLDSFYFKYTKKLIKLKKFRISFIIKMFTDFYMKTQKKIFLILNDTWLRKSMSYSLLRRKLCAWMKKLVSFFSSCSFSLSLVEKCFLLFSYNIDKHWNRPLN